jgi:hypothetical protein
MERPLRSRLELALAREPAESAHFEDKRSAASCARFGRFAFSHTVSQIHPSVGYPWKGKMGVSFEWI